MSVMLARLAQILGLGVFKISGCAGQLERALGGIDNGL
jgi:hypothetical protein